MKTRNVTLALPEQLVRRVKILAAERNTSISQLMVAALEEEVERETGRLAALHRLRAAMDNAPDGEFVDGRRPTRDELHERG